MIGPWSGKDEETKEKGSPALGSARSKKVVGESAASSSTDRDGVARDVGVTDPFELSDGVTGNTAGCGTAAVGGGGGSDRARISLHGHELRNAHIGETKQ